MASKLFPHVFTPGRIGTLELKNRVMKAPQSSGMSNKDGTVSERLIRYYRNQASGGAGMIIVEYAYVDDIGAKSAHCHLGISQNEHIPGLTWLAENIKECGAAAGIQIEHCGRQKFLGTQPMCAPSAIPWPKLWDQYGLQAVPHVLTIEEIQDIVHAFGDAAWRAKVAGFDLVEIHGAHGYLLTNFFSPTTNHRTDLYGGTLENRMRIYIEIARDVRKKVGPDFPVTIRLSGTDYEPDGFPIEDTLVLAKALENEGIDAFHISGGDHHTMIHQTSPMAMDHGHNVWAAEAIKKVVSVPVIASGSINTPELAEEVIASGKGDFVGLGRPLWADPEWPKKAEADHPEDIRPCIRCNEGCLERTFYCYKAVSCALNPQISREGELEITLAAVKKNIAVVGGGPAGLEAARVLSLRGHSVTVFEKGELGGQLNEASVPEFKADIRGLKDYLITAVNKQGVNIVRREATADDLNGYDAVICATGSKPKACHLPGAEHAVDAADVLNGKVKVGNKVVMLGVGLVGSETALWLAENGHDVTLVGRGPQIMKGVASTDALAYSERIAKAGMTVCTNTTPLEIVDGGVMVKFKGKVRKIEADTVVYAFGAAAQHALYDELKGSGKEVYLVGDAKGPAKIMDAIYTAYKLSIKL